MYATKLSAFNTVRTFASLVLKSQKEIWDVTDSIKIPQGSRKSEGNESLRDFIQTHTMLDTLGSVHHFVLVPSAIYNDPLADLEYVRFS